MMSGLLPFLLLFSLESFDPVVDQQIIRETRIKSNQAIAKHDTATLALYWTEDVHVTTSRSIELSGRVANQRAFQQEFQTKEKLLYVRSTNTVEIFPNWNMAAENGNWTGTWTLAGVPIRIGGSYYAKWHRIDGVWKIRAEVYTPTFCEGGDYCKKN